MKHIYTTNPVESVNNMIVKVRINLGGYFQSVDILEINLLIQRDNLKNEKWKKPIPAFRDCSKNPHHHSERSEESHLFLFKSKNQKRDPSSDFILRMARKCKLTKILEHSPKLLTSLFYSISFS
jgi:hypothetical protein